MSRTSLDPLEWLAGHWPAVVAASLACVLLTAGISWFLGYAISRPVRAITRAAQAVARGEQRPRFSPAGIVPAEVHALSESLDVMTRQLTDRARTISDFATSLSHEMKTPLAGIRGAVELLRDDWEGMSPEQRTRFLDNVGADSARMQALVERLLQLARVQSAPDTAEEIAVRDFFERLVRPLGERVVLDLSRAPATISINRDHLGFAVRNLLDNALRHGAGKAVKIVVAAPEGRLTIDVTDRGPGIREADRERVFEPFFTTERERGGTGLGLAIVRAVAETRAGSVVVHSGPEGTTFTLKL
jgi:signal transduction histidine kinase